MRKYFRLRLALPDEDGEGIMLGVRSLFLTRRVYRSQDAGKMAGKTDRWRRAKCFRPVLLPVVWSPSSALDLPPGPVSAAYSGNHLIVIFVCLGHTDTILGP